MALNDHAKTLKLALNRPSSSIDFRKATYYKDEGNLIKMALLKNEEEGENDVFEKKFLLKDTRTQLPLIA